MYGPVCPVVWEGWSREAPPYPDCFSPPSARIGPQQEYSWMVGPSPTMTQGGATEVKTEPDRLYTGLWTIARQTPPEATAMDIPVTEAKARLSELIRRAEAGEEIVLTPTGSPRRC